MQSIYHDIVFVSLPAEFEAFALTHPEYAKLFTTYLELQRYQALKVSGDEGPEWPLEEALLQGPGPADQGSDSASDKKDD